MATRADLRLAIGYELNDVLPITVTAHANNSTTRLYAVGQINAGAESNAGREIIFTSGTNRGLIRRILATNPREGWVDLDRAVDATIAADDTAEMYGFRGKGWRIDHYHHEINRAISSAAPAHKGTRVEEVLGDLFDAEDPIIDVPTSLNWVAAVEYLPTRATRYMTVPMAEDRLFRGWSVDEPNEAIVVRGDDLLTAMNGATIRLIGYQKAGPLAAETDTTTVPENWIIDRAKERMYMPSTDRVTENYNKAMVSREDAQMRSKIALRTRGLGARAKWVRD
jgi:hypothetical protein